MDATTVIEKKYRALAERLDEATLRLWAAVEARALGRGGVSAVASAVGLSRTTIYAGLRELAAPGNTTLVGNTRRVRAKGGGRKKLTAKDPMLLRDLDALVEPTTRGDPQSPLRWTCKSTPRLAKELSARGHQVSQRSVCDLLAQLDYSLQATRKIHEGGKHADRDAQFGHIAAMAA
jgi:transposase